MSAILATQLGPLTWVKPEIDFALERARASLATYFADPAGNADTLSAALASVREVTGALQIIGMEALGAFSKDIDAVLVALEKRDIAPTPELAQLLGRASASLARHLGDLMAGAPENAVSLRPLLNELAQARGGQPVDDYALFHPDLSVFPPPLASPNLLQGDELFDFVRVCRGRYQRGMLNWLRGSEDGLVQMLEALQEIERAQPAPGRRAPWWVSSAFVDGLLRGGFAVTDEMKRAAGRIDRYMATFASGDPASTQLMRELLFHLVQCEPVTALVRDVKSLYGLYRYAPASASWAVVEIDTAEFEPVLRRAKELIAPDTCVRAEHRRAMTQEVAAELQECLTELCELSHAIRSQPVTALIDAMLLTTADLAVLDADVQAAIVIETAAALSALEERLEACRISMPEAIAEFDARRRTLLACLSRTQAAAERCNRARNEPNPSPGDERELLQVVGSEMLATLQQAERSLDSFFRGQVPTPPLIELPGLLGSVAGALRVLDVENAAQLIERSTSIIAMLDEPGRIVSEDKTALLAEGLSSVMLYVGALDRDNRDELRAVETILARFDAREAMVASSSVLDLQTIAEDGPAGHADELDFELFPTEGRSDGDRDGEEVTHGDIDEILDRFDLSALRDEPDALQAASGESILEHRAHLSDETAEQEWHGADAPSGDLERDGIEVDARSEGVDPEIVSIFIEEANELLEAMGDLLERARVQPGDWGNLTTLRRGFHTLKGSGRMAGLHAVGDAAWMIESLLNRWLEAERPASEELIDLAALARNLFTGWITDMAQQGRTTVRAGALSAKTAFLASELAAPRAGIPRTVEPDDTLPIASLDMTMEAAAAEPTPDTVEASLSTLPAPLFQIFVEEARQNVEALRMGLAALEFAPDDETRDTVIRAAHTIGGIARATGFKDITLVASVIENAPFGHPDCPTTSELLRSALSTLKALIDAVAKGRTPELSADLRAQFEREADACSDAAGESVASPPAIALEFSVEDAEDLQRSEADSGGMSAFSNGESGGARDHRVLKDDIDPQLLPIFLDEVRDLGPLIGEDLRHLRSEPQDAAAFDSLRRVLHTIKGGARMVGAIRLGELVHIMEGRLEAVEGGAVNPDVLDLLEREFDRLTIGLEALESGEPESKLPVAGGAIDGSRYAKQAPQDRSTGDSVPSFSAHIRVAADTLDRLLNQAGEISISRGRIETEAQTLKQFLIELTDSVARLRGQLKEIEIQAESRLQATQNQTIEHDAAFDPLELDRFTRFQELTRLMAESLHDVATVQRHLLDGVDEVQAALSVESRLNRILQDDLMRLRTVTFQNVSERLYRVARQAARETGKKVEFELIGGQTEVDRGVLERMAAPLEHLVRNAVTHGIEALDDRVGAGKREAGTIRLILRQEINDLLISLADDGRGIDHERIRTKARELGWLPVGAEPSHSELEQMILRPGFSTASEVSELAGRGVGMDVVANEVYALGGSIEITTESGRGTTFTIRVPLTLAVAKAILVSASGRRWAILTNLVEQVQEVPVARASDLCASEALEWLDHRYPVFYLPQLLGESTTPSVDRSKYFVLLIRSADRRVAVLVDHLTVNQDIVLKAIGPQLAGLPGVNGATVLPDGEIVFVVDPALLMERRRIRQVPAIEATAETSRAAPLIMVVDDSLTVRNVTSRLLARHGYRVATARDGLDALQQMQDKTPDALLVDIEMPRMDGFDLTKNLKASQRTSRLPIIMITSRLAQKHREYADKLGVNVYLGKPFEEQELLAHLSTFTAAAGTA